MPKISEYLTVGKAADLLGVTKDMLRRWDRSGTLEARRHPVASYRLYLKKEREVFLRQLADGGNVRGRASQGKRKSTRSGRRVS